MNVWDIILGLIVLTAIVGVMKYMGHTRGCGGNCSECPHPCRSRSGRGISSLPYLTILFLEEFFAETVGS